MRPEVFEQIRQLADIQAVASSYGVEVKRGNKASCPFHQDRNPSMSFKNNRFKCFSCGESGSVIDLVMKLLNVDKDEAAKRINEDFGLGLDLKKPADKKAVRKRREEDRLRNAFWEWEHRAFLAYVWKLRRLERVMNNLSPRLDDPNRTALYAEAANMKPRIEYIVDTLINGDFEEKLEIFKNCRKEAARIEQERRNSKTE